MVEHFIIIFVVYVSTKSVVSFVRCVSGGGMDGSRKRKWLKRREEKREREFLSLNLFVVKRRRRGRLVWFGLVTTPIRKRTYEREYEGGPRFYT